MMNSRIRTFGVGAAAAAMCLMLAGAMTQVTAQQRGRSVADLLRSLRETQRAESAENRRREQEFLRQRGRQQALLNQARSDLANEKALSTRLEETKKANEEEIKVLEADLAKALGENAEFFGVTRQVAGETIAQIESSLISAEYPGRDRDIDILTRSRTLPTAEDLGRLWYVLLQEAAEQGKISTFTTNVISDRDGKPVEAEVMRIGPFVAVMKRNGDFLRYTAGSLVMIPRQPAARYQEGADSLVRARPGTRTEATIDPSRGALLDLLVRVPTFIQKIQAGGTIGYIIIALGTLGVILAILRLLDLFGVSGRVRAQMRSKKIGNNPLGRVMKAYEDNKSADVETLELKLDDAILKELPRLEFGLTTVKVLAAVAPLLGLLGTVTGMIQVFQQITLYGAGDPKTMAGGISLALVTTWQGLWAAVPLVLLHSFAAGRAKAVTQILEEQAAGIVARHAEQRAS